MSQITTHVLDTAIGKPAQGIHATLEVFNGESWAKVASGTTNSDGRVPNLLPDDETLALGNYRMTFDTDSYFKLNDIEGFYPYVSIVFKIYDTSHYHIPLLLSPYGYSTYRGS